MHTYFIEVKIIEKLELSYTINALEPYYSAQTLDIHYNILYQGYIENTNKTLEKLDQARKEKNFTNIKCLEKDLSFYESGVILHQLFFENMSNFITRPNINLMQQIRKDFINFEIFKKQFIQSAQTVEGSGWCLLVWIEELKKMEILQCEKHQNLTIWSCKPLLVLDMWEHSYYLQYQTKRLQYIEAFWNIINWNIVNKRFNKIKLLEY